MELVDETGKEVKIPENLIDEFNEIGNTFTRTQHVAFTEEPYPNNGALYGDGFLGRKNSKEFLENFYLALAPDNKLDLSIPLTPGELKDAVKYAVKNTTGRIRLHDEFKMGDMAGNLFSRENLNKQVELAQGKLDSSKLIAKVDFYPSGYSMAGSEDVGKDPLFSMVFVRDPAMSTGDFIRNSADVQDKITKRIQNMRNGVEPINPKFMEAMSAYGDTKALENSIQERLAQAKTAAVQATVSITPSVSTTAVSPLEEFYGSSFKQSPEDIKNAQQEESVLNKYFDGPIFKAAVKERMDNDELLKADKKLLASAQAKLKAATKDLKSPSEKGANAITNSLQIAVVTAEKTKQGREQRIIDDLKNQYIMGHLQLETNPEAMSL